MAARAFPGAAPARVGLFSRWLVWLFDLDDRWDEGPAGRDPAGVDAVFDALVGVVRGDAPGPDPAVLGFAGLWRATAPGMSAAWRDRVAGHLRAQWDGVRAEVDNRRAGRIPALGEYPALRRDSNGTYLMLDVAETVVGREVPAAVAASPEWQAYTEAANDVVVWANDLASLAKERASGEVHNYVVVAGHSLGLEPDDATRWVEARLATRIRELDAASRTLAPTDVVRTITAATKAHAHWLNESPRYHPR